MRENDELDIEVERGAIRLVPRRGKLKLSELVRAIRPESIHSEIDFGPNRGRELW